jgi:ankyrin repeat protein
MAAWHNYTDIVELLLAHGANANAKDKEARTPLVMTTSADVARLLLQHGADPNVTDKLHNTPLSRAAETGNVELFKVLVEHGANLSQEALTRALYRAVDSDSKDMVDFLLANKADIKVRDGAGNTLLHRAVWLDQQPSAFRWSGNAAEALLAHGADVNARNNSGETPLHLAAPRADKNAMEVLLAHNADINARSNSGDTVLGFSIRAENKLMSRLTDPNRVVANWSKLHEGLTVDKVDELVGPLPDWAKGWVKVSVLEATTQPLTGGVAVNKLYQNGMSAKSESSPEGSIVTLGPGTEVFHDALFPTFELIFKNGTLTSWTMHANVFHYQDVIDFLRAKGGHE